MTYTRPITAVRDMVASDTQWFDPATMRFFSSRVARRAYIGPHGTVFVSSEQFDARSPRRYSVRRVWRDGESRWHVDTVGEFQGFTTRREADRAARRYVETGLL